MVLKSRDTLANNYNYNQRDTADQESQTASLTTIANCVSNNVLSVSSSGGSSDTIIKGNDGNDGSGAVRTIKTDANGKLQIHDAGLDAHLVNLLGKITDGTQKSIMLGNTSGDGSGDSHHLHVDSNGNAKCIIVNSLNTIPANNTNSGITDDPANSVAVGMRARTDKALASSEIFCEATSAGELKTNLSSQTGNLNIKIEDLSSSIDAEHANNSRSLPTTLKARQVIADETSGKYLLCSSLGELKVQINEIKAGILNSINTHNTNQNTNTQVLTNVAKAIGQSAQSTAIETINNSDVYSDTNHNIYGHSVVIYIDTGANTNTTNFSFEVHKSYDGIKYFLDSSFVFNAMGADVNANPVPAVVAKGGFDGRFIRVKVNNLSEAQTTSINAYIQQRH